MLFISCFLLSLHLCHASGREVYIPKRIRASHIQYFKILHLFTLLYYIYLGKARCQIIG